MKTASIVLLVGTSTAGKSTIIEKIKEQNSLLPEDERMDWQVDGTDLAIKRKLEKMDKILLDTLEEFEEFKKIQPSFSSTEGAVKLRDPVFRGSLTEGEDTLSLTNTETYKRDVDDFIAQTKGIYSRETLDNLHSLVLEKGQEIKQKTEQTWKTQIGDLNELIFREAIKSSKEGKPIILDLAPIPGPDNIFEKFEKYLEQENFSCPTQFIIVHVDPKELSKRMHERNRKALAEGGDRTDLRNGAFPFEQYSYIFTKAEEGDRVIAQVAKTDFLQAFNAFSKDNEAATALIDKMQFGSEDSVNITASGKNIDAVYPNDSAEAITAIAKKIIAGATDKSLTPTSPHPVANLFKEGFEKAIEDIKQNDNTSFVEKLGLKKSDQQQSWTTRSRNNSSEGKNSNELG